MGQFVYEITPMEKGNTKGFDLMCGVMQGQMILLSDAYKSRSDLPLLEKGTLSLSLGNLNPEWNNIESVSSFFPKFGSKSDGSACFNPKDSTLYFSSYNPIVPELNLTTSAIYSMKWDGKNWKNPNVLPFCVDGFNYLHPWFDQELNVLVFSSDKKGGHGGADLWFAYKTDDDKWTFPANAGGQVNTSGNELFPTMFQGDIYYCSNGLVPERGFELFKAEGKNQWMNAIQLESPLNSREDDLRIIFLSEDKGYLVSSRETSIGSQDVFVFHRKPRQPILHSYYLKLEANNNTLPGVELKFFEPSGALALKGTTDLKGELSLAALLPSNKYKVTVQGVLPKLLPSVKLVVMDEAGNVMGTFKFNEKGELILELLQFNYLDLPLAENHDESVLQINLEGKVLTQSIIKQRIPVLIEDHLGNVIATVYTDLSGSFQLQKLSPKSEYIFKISAKYRPDQLVVLDSGKTLVLPFLKEEAYYRRIPESDVISLKNENGDSIEISSNDIFIVNRIYYELNSARLTSQSLEQLNELLKILQLNPEIDLKLYAHTDARGSDQYNFQLSLNRAKSIKEFLVSKKIDSSRLNTEALGETDLMNYCDDNSHCSEIEHAVNRRTEIKFVRRSYSQN